jgi:hypothetical protein
VLSYHVAKKGQFVDVQKVSDNFTGVGTVGRVCFENDWKFSGLKMWHYCCFYI